MSTLGSTSALDATDFVMPPEWAPHAATWMAFPPAVYEGDVSLDNARAAWASVARAVSEFEPVRMMVRPSDVTSATALLGTDVQYVEMELNDAWARDIGPTFVQRASGETRAIDWRFNGWGNQSWAQWSHDDAAAATVASAAGVQSVRSELVNEGGGIEVDGAGTLLVTETVQLDPDRNPGLSRNRVEELLCLALGTTRVVWLKRGLSGDYQEFGTRGHVDLLAKFVAPGVVLMHDQQNVTHPDHEVSRELRVALERAGLEVIALRAPQRTHEGGRLCDWSYVNCYVANGAVIVGVYDDPADDDAVATLSELFPSRRVVTVDARPLFALGGGVHCITQQQPE